MAEPELGSATSASTLSSLHLCCFLICLGLCRPAAVKESQVVVSRVFDLSLVPVSCLGNVTVILSFTPFALFFLFTNSWSLTGSLGEVLLGLSMLASLHSETRCETGVIVTSPGFS